MDCCICSPLVSMYRPPRNSICQSCYDGAKQIISFFDELDNNKELRISAKNHGTKPCSSKGISDAFEGLKEMKEREEDMIEKLAFLEGFGVALDERMHTDILLRPSNGHPIPAHRALLAARSQVFKNVLTSDECKASVEESISFPDFTNDELNSFLYFLYHGNLPEETDSTKYYFLSVAADKYDIPYLRKYCEKYILRSLDPFNALEVLEISELCQNETLKAHAMDLIVKHADEIVFSKKYGEFALKNAHLCVEITRELLVRKKDNKYEAHN